MLWRAWFLSHSGLPVAIDKARGNIVEGDEDRFGGSTKEGIGRAFNNNRFGLGQAQIGFETNDMILHPQMNLIEIFVE